MVKVCTRVREKDMLQVKKNGGSIYKPWLETLY